MSRPRENRFVFAALPCSESQHSQKESATCRGKIPKDLKSAFAVVQDLWNGNVFTVDFQGNPAPADLVMEILENEESVEVLPRVQFQSSCSVPVNLGDKFGSIAIYGFANGEQGVTSNDLELTCDVTLSLPVASPRVDEDLLLVNLESMSLYDLTWSTEGALRHRDEEFTLCCVHDCPSQRDDELHFR